MGCTPVIPALGRQRQGVKASLVYSASSRTTKGTQKLSQTTTNITKDESEEEDTPSQLLAFTHPTRKRVNSYWAACCDSIVLITQEAEAGGPQVQGQSGQLSEVQTK